MRCFDFEAGMAATSESNLPLLAKVKIEGWRESS
jgi:hypothetical protein